MNFLFLHQNFPGQFAHLAPALAARGHNVVGLGARRDRAGTRGGVRVLAYRHDEPEGRKTHPWVSTFDRAVDRGAAVFRALAAMKARGFRPDAVVAHSGWGEALFVRDVWPEVPLGVYSEMFYHGEGADVGFDPEFATREEFGRAARMRLRNLAMRQQLEMADSGLSPTRWQAATIPADLRRKTSVIFDGIRTERVAPDPEAVFEAGGAPRLTRSDEVIGFVNRNLEPYRGFHVFMRALPEVLRRRPAARIVIVGGEGTSYGPGPQGGGTWKDRLVAEIAPRMSDDDWRRVHFTGRLPYADYLSLLQVARVHVYLTYPFVLSWSLVEAMSAGCAIVASDTAPVREVIETGQTGVLVDFFDRDRLVDEICALADDPGRRAALGHAARAHVVRHYDLESVSLPAQFDWVSDLAGQPV